MKYLIVDISNILYGTFYAYKQEDDQTIAGLAHANGLTTINSYYNKHKPDKIIMCFDRPNWRKEYTKSDKCLSGKLYKGTRRKDMTPKEQVKYQQFCESIAEFEDIVREHTSIMVMAAAGLEADDLMAGCCEYFTIVNPENEIVIISADKDLMQLLRYPQVSLFEPRKGAERTLDEWGGSADLFMYEKCIRGDRGDNVQSAYPGIRKTRFMEAWEDPMKYETMMHHEWSPPGHIPADDDDGHKFVVKDLFKENQLLMDLEMQPEHIRETIFKTIMVAEKNPGKFSYFHFMKFLGRYNMDKLASKAKDFATALSR